MFRRSSTSKLVFHEFVFSPLTGLVYIFKYIYAYMQATKITSNNVMELSTIKPDCHMRFKENVFFRKYSLLAYYKNKDFSILQAIHHLKANTVYMYICVFLSILIYSAGMAITRTYRGFQAGDDTGIFQFKPVSSGTISHVSCRQETRIFLLECVPCYGSRNTNYSLQ